jgi:hypothetical protein
MENPWKTTVIVGVSRTMGTQGNYYDRVYFGNKRVRRLYDFEASFLGPNFDAYEMQELSIALAKAGVPVLKHVEAIEQIAYVQNMRIVKITFTNQGE